MKKLTEMELFYLHQSLNSLYTIYNQNDRLGSADIVKTIKQIESLIEKLNKKLNN